MEQTLTCSRSEPSFAQLHVINFCLSICAMGDTMLEGGRISCCVMIRGRMGGRVMMESKKWGCAHGIEGRREEELKAGYVGKGSMLCSRIC